jgi:hypothetical protein
MSIINYKSSQIKLNVPTKVLPVNVTALSGTEYWQHANAADDIWYSGSPTKKYYRWQITFDVTEQTHGSNLTRNSFEYNGLDIVIGDWIAGATSGICLKVVSILSKTATQVTCVVEDWLRYNTFKSTTGNGIFNLGTAVVFGLNENGLPMLDPLPTTVNNGFYATVMSRFQYLNPLLNYVLYKENHGFEKSDVVVATSEGFAKANATSMSKMVGVVVESGPGPDLFMISPNNRIIDFEPGIPGTVGQYVYVDTDGDLTVNDTGKIVFLKIQDAIPTVLTGNVVNPTIPSGHTVTFNDIGVTFAGTGNITLANIVAQINTETANHHVVADSVAAPTVVTSSATGTAYGLVGGYAPFSAYIDSGSGNTLINFTTTTAGQAAYSLAVAIPEDMADDINNVGIANLTATATTTSLILTELNGNTVNIYNANVDVNGNSFVGNSNISGLPAATSATIGEILVLTRDDGGEILIYEDTEFLRVNTGITSGHTGMYPLALNVEQGIRTGSTTVVANISARDALSAQVGDQAYVLNAGNGEWGIYLYDGTSWVQLGNQDSSTVDAKTMTTTFTMPVAGFGNSTTNTLGNISPGRKIVSVSMEIDTAFSGYAGNILPNIEVGTIADQDIFVADVSNDLTDSTVDFIVHPEYVYPASNSQDLQIRVRCNHYQSTSGNVTVKLTYV